MMQKRMTEATPNDTPKVQHFSESAQKLQKKIEEGLGNLPNSEQNPLDVIADKLLYDSQAAAEAGEEARDVWKKYIFDFSNRDVAMPEYLLSINGVGMFARRSLTCITGRAGQGKSHALIPIVAAQLKQHELLGVTLLRPINRILWHDTEQEPWAVSEKANRLLRLMGLPDFSPTPKKLTMLTTRQAASNKERLEVTNTAIRGLDPDVVIIDGITDLVQHIEDPDEAQQLVANLLKMIDERGITLFVVIHQNESGESSKLRAFIGSELMRKASNILQVSVKEGCFEIEQTKSRGVPMPKYRIRIDSDGNLTQSMAQSPQTEEGRLADIMGKVIVRRNGTFDSKKQIYTYIVAHTGGSEAKAKNLFETAEALKVVHVDYDGHKYKLTLTAGNSGTNNFAVGG